ncbi:triadin-like [Physella acuta]|uniref:triadin-like n=1 Tax=Physella acuta TaxID=109671 RepID=UPI0027DADFFE|nr:triadin-like [Physella acuta]
MEAKTQSEAPGAKENPLGVVWSYSSFHRTPSEETLQLKKTKKKEKQEEHVRKPKDDTPAPTAKTQSEAPGAKENPLGVVWSYSSFHRTPSEETLQLKKTKKKEKQEEHVRKPKDDTPAPTAKTQSEAPGAKENPLGVVWSYSSFHRTPSEETLQLKKTKKKEKQEEHVRKPKDDTPAPTAKTQSEAPGAWENPLGVVWSYSSFHRTPSEETLQLKKTKKKEKQEEHVRKPKDDTPAPTAKTQSEAPGAWENPLGVVWSYSSFHRTPSEETLQLKKTKKKEKNDIGSY